MTGRDRHDLAVTLPWMRQGTSLVLAVADQLTDEDLRRPSGLPGWTRAHVLGHLARNAEALGRLASWARTGVSTPMYAAREQRAAEIETSAELPAPVLREELKYTAAEFDEALAQLTDTTWRAQVRSALGRAIPAAEIPWMRVREVWLHAVDLAAGVTVSELPAEVVDVLLDDVTGTLSARPGCPAVQLVPTDRDCAWQLSPADGAARTRGQTPTRTPAQSLAAGTAAELLAWVTGRADETIRAKYPAVPVWL
jgi:maleylpyruvate isomerase